MNADDGVNPEGAGVDPAHLAGAMPERRVRIIARGPTGAGTRVEGLEHAKIVSVEVPPFGPDDQILARIVILDPELDITARDDDTPPDALPAPALRALDPEPEPIPVESVARLRMRRGDVLVVNVPASCGPLSEKDHERIKSTMRSVGILAPIMVLEGGISLAVVNQQAIALPSDTRTPGVSP